MEITNELRTLAKFTAGEIPVVSVYLDAQWRDQHQRERVATFLRRHVRQTRLIETESAAVRSSLEADLTRIEQWGETLLRGKGENQAPGIALFACHGGDLWAEFDAPVPFRDAFTIADRPALRQLAALNGGYANVLVVLVDSQAARICEVVFGGLLTETDVSNEVPGRHKQGGWAQMRYQRHVKDHMDRHHKDVSDYLASTIVSHPQTSIIVSGPNEIVANFRRFLPPLVQQRIIEEIRLDIRESSARIVQTAQDVTQRQEQESQRENVQRLLNEAGQGGLAVLGMQETLAAANTGRVHQLIMQRDMQQHGWRCLECGSLGEAQPQQCPVCTGQTRGVELGEALVNKTLETDGLVELVEPREARLASYEGVGALVRYK